MFILTQPARNVLYLMYMNKEVIYLEPEDDITDVLTKLQRAEQKLVALVPPKKATILRSAVNMKLIARTAKDCEKVAVIVTGDPAVIKLAMAARIPVAKTLQSRPMVPTPEMLQESKSSEQVIDEDLAEKSEKSAGNAQNPGKSASNSTSKTTKTAPETPEGTLDASDADGAVTLDLTDEGLAAAAEKGQKSAKSGKKSAKSAQKVPSLEKYRKWIILGSVTGVLLIIFLVWAFVFAPAATITVAMRTTSENFSETVNFTTDINSENIAEGRLFAHQQSYEQKYETKVTATGEEDRGERATGELVLTKSAGASSVLVSGLSIDVPEGATFTAGNGLTYTAIMAKSTAVNDFETDCSGSGLSYTCSLTLTVPVQATAPGDNYNLSTESTWNSFSGASVSNPKAISGGTSNKVKVIAQSDVDQARDQLVSDHATEGKESLFSDLAEQNAVVIEPSYTSETTNTSATPAVGEEGNETTVSVTVKYAVYTVDEAKVESFIAEKMSLNDDQKLYSIGSPYFERFTNLEEPARLKTVVAIGPVLTEDTILDRVKGVKIGEAQSILKSINGVSSVEITPSYFWVRSVPNDPNKITINLQMEGETEDQQ